MALRDMSGIKWVVVFVGVTSFILGVVGLITGEALEPSGRGHRGVLRNINEDEAAFATVLMWRFGIAILCFLFLWLFRERKSDLY